MKKLKLLLLAGFFVPVLSFSPVLAEETNNSTDDTSTTTTTDDGTTTTESAAELKQKQEDRIAAYKEKQKIRLAALEEKKLQTTCKAAQGHVRSLIARTNNVKSNRKKIYQELGTKLDNLITKLKAREIDTTSLEAARTELQTKADALTDQITTFEQTLTDLTEMDCAADPEAFKAALEDARDQREAIGTSAKELRTYVKTTLHDILKELRTKVAEKTGEASTTNESTEQSEGGQ